MTKIHEAGRIALVTLSGYFPEILNELTPDIQAAGAACGLGGG